MWVAKSPDLVHWGAHAPLAVAGGEWQSGRVGAGAPPLQVDAGWLEIYHGNRQSNRPGEVGACYAGAVLLDKNDPSKVLARSHAPFFVPEADFEQAGFIPNVVFPTGAVRDRGSLLVYYGAADECMAAAEFSEHDLLASLIRHSRHASPALGVCHRTP